MKMARMRACAHAACAVTAAARRDARDGAGGGGRSGGGVLARVRAGAVFTLAQLCVFVRAYGAVMAQGCTLSTTPDVVCKGRFDRGGGPRGVASIQMAVVHVVWGGRLYRRGRTWMIVDRAIMRPSCVCNSSDVRWSPVFVYEAHAWGRHWSSKVANERHTKMGVCVFHKRARTPLSLWRTPRVS